MENRQTLLSDKNLRFWNQQQIPVQNIFELTPRCTLDCRMCYIHLTPEQMGERRELSTEQWIRITDEAVEAGMLYVVLTGGECMLHPGFWEIYEHLLDKGVIVTINTNAFTLTDADIERFRSRPPAAFRVTLYGSTEEGYERCTGHRAFGRVLRNLHKLRDAGFLVVIAITLSRYNKDEFLDMVRIGEELGVSISYVLELNEANEDTGRRLEDYDLTQEEIIAKTREIHEMQHRPIFQNEPITELPPRQPDAPPQYRMRCGSGIRSFVLHWDGRMSPCFMLQNELKVQDVGFRAAWEETKRLGREALQPVECFSCRLRPICHECAILRTDPAAPGHANPARCRMTIARWNAGVITLKDEAHPDAGLLTGNPDC